MPKQDNPKLQVCDGNVLLKHVVCAFAGFRFKKAQMFSL